ncbi:MAG: hypothetical protein KF773_12235 [Deltaproteobacteria bacterium]|nr:hypothetical protein [Deltaproteobacteria bacterium]
MQMRARRVPSTLRTSSGDEESSDVLLELVEDMRARFSTVDAFTSAAAELFDRIPWPRRRAHRRDFTRLSHLLSQAATMVSESAVESERRLRLALKRRRRR